eukprot:CAMPEP_0172835844 /NCGR_PEP_ID=MMETSP1075-20121228/26062_1 /TAXON_ID=2916 /ORGANISM="Ceratium fusus, Strain PA161109" /LENGTH=96 /DNA_ID=CAMNT_0013678965 /DNA_START=19 /DNA_END=309 /DNA_ORIENTATION=+
MRSTIFAWTFLASSSSSLNGSFERIMPHAFTSGGHCALLSIASVTMAATALSSAIRAFSSRLPLPTLAALITIANLVKDSGAASAKRGSGAAKLTA